MKRGLLITSLILGTLPPATAGGVFYNSNQSAEYFRTFDRNSAIDSADIVYYNMAGTVKLKEGFTFNLSNQSIFQKATVKTLGNPVLGDRTYDSDNPAWLVPNFYVAYRKGNWSLFGGMEAIGATAIREWKNGLPTLDLLGKQLVGYGGAASGVIAGDAYVAALMAGKTPAEAQAAAVSAGLSSQHFKSSSHLKGSSYYMAVRLGGAYQLTPKVSVALAGRYVTAKQAIVGHVDGENTYNQAGHDLRQKARVVIDTTDEATGFSGEFGLNVCPTDQIVFSLTYEMATPLKFKTTVNEGKDGGGLFVNGKEANLDLPRALRLGLGYQVSSALRVSGGLNRYFENSVDFSMLNNPANRNDFQQDYGDTTEACMSAEYRLNAKWLLSGGVNYNWIGQKKQSTIDISVPGAHSNYASIGAGFQYAFSDKLKFNLGLGHTRFVGTYENADVMGDQALKSAFAANGVAINPRKEYDKKYIIVAFGLDYRF